MDKRICLTIITINYQTWEATLGLIKSLGYSKALQIIVIDNSPDTSLKAAIEKEYPWIKYVPMEKNVGYAAGINAGIKHAKNDWIMVLNNDMEVSGEELLKLVNVTDTQKALFAAPRLIKTNGSIQDNVGFFDPWNKNRRNALFARPRLINASEIKEPTKVDLATGGAVLFHKKVIEQVGKWDERFFMYFEDIDFGLRLKKAGISVLYVPSVTLTHLKGFTANRDPKTKICNYDRARAKYLKKHRGVIMKIINDFLNLY